MQKNTENSINIQQEDGPAYAFKDKYSIVHDILMGWQPKQPLSGPIPFCFENHPFDLIIRKLTQFFKYNYNPHPQRIVYLGWRPTNTFKLHQEFCPKSYQFMFFEMSKSKFLYNFFSKHYPDLSFNINQRIFIGMNPTIQQPDLTFDSKFQSGNLDAVIKIEERVYDLITRADSNTRGHCQYFYFKVKNTLKGKYQFNIINYKREKTLYQNVIQHYQGMKPYIFSKKEKYYQKKQDWQQGGQNVTYQKKPLRYQFLAQQVYNYQYYSIIRQLKFYTLSFQYQFKYDQDQVSFAYCVPYTYSNLLRYIRSLTDKEFIRKTKLVNSLSGVQIPLLTITEAGVQSLEKKCVVVNGRIHPGESNGSYVMHGLIEFLCGNSDQAKQLRKRIIFKIVPMLNVDGVIIGNSRTSFSGKDLNRLFETQNRMLYPQVVSLKKLVEQCKKKYCSNFLAFIDLHGHSAKRNVFIYGPGYMINQINYQKCRLIPRLLSKRTQMFRYYSSSFKISKQKKNTARVVFNIKNKITNCYTIESSVDSYYDYDKREMVPFNTNAWKQMGSKIGLAIFDYTLILNQRERMRRQRLKVVEQRRDKVQTKQANLEQFLTKRTNQQNSFQASRWQISRQQQQQEQLSKQQLQLQQKQLGYEENEVQEQEYVQGGSDSEPQCEDLQQNRLKGLHKKIVQNNRIFVKELRSNRLEYYQESIIINKPIKQKYIDKNIENSNFTSNYNTLQKQKHLFDFTLKHNSQKKYFYDTPALKNIDIQKQNQNQNQKEKVRFIDSELQNKDFKGLKVTHNSFKKIKLSNKKLDLQLYFIRNTNRQSNFGNLLHGNNQAFENVMIRAKFGQKKSSFRIVSQNQKSGYSKYRKSRSPVSLNKNKLNGAQKALQRKKSIQQIKPSINQKIRVNIDSILAKSLPRIIKFKSII